MLQFATVVVPLTPDTHALAERLWRRLGTGECSVRPDGETAVISLALEMPDRFRLTEAKIREALPSSVRAAATIRLAGEAEPPHG